MENCVLLNWNDVYKIGHEKVDEEHQKLFELANKVALCEDNKDEIMKAVKELIKYTKFHFANEEQYMKSINFVYLDEHKILHKNLVAQINNLLNNISSLSLEEIQKQLSSLININVVNHILTEDKRVHHQRRSHDELKDMFSWKDTYKIEYEDIDDEHHKLFDIAIKALNYTDKNPKEHIRTILFELYDYMKIHFKHEEDYMQSINYFDFENHKKIHDNIIIQLNEFIKKIPTISMEKAERLLIEYMDVWLINHIITEDQKIICFQKNIENQAS